MIRSKAAGVFGFNSVGGFGWRLRMASKTVAVVAPENGRQPVVSYTRTPNLRACNKTCPETRLWGAESFVLDRQSRREENWALGHVPRSCPAEPPRTSRASIRLFRVCTTVFTARLRNAW
jgi:hypothetical protein